LPLELPLPLVLLELPPELPRIFVFDVVFPFATVAFSKPAALIAVQSVSNPGVVQAKVVALEQFPPVEAEEAPVEDELDVEDVGDAPDAVGSDALPEGTETLPETGFDGADTELGVPLDDVGVVALPEVGTETLPETGADAGALPDTELGVPLDDVGFVALPEVGTETLPETGADAGARPSAGADVRFIARTGTVTGFAAWPEVGDDAPPAAEEDAEGIDAPREAGEEEARPSAGADVRFIARTGIVTGFAAWPEVGVDAPPEAGEEDAVGVNAPREAGEEEVEGVDPRPEGGANV
jgi:hypothetical protein